MESWYDDEEDILNIQLKEGTYWKSIELSNGVVLDISKEGTILSLEFLQASKIFKGDIKNVLQKARQLS